MGSGEHSHISGLVASSPAARGELEGPSRHQDPSFGSLTSSEMPDGGVPQFTHLSRDWTKRPTGGSLRSNDLRFQAPVNGPGR